MKLYNYSIARSLTIITGIIFVTQFFFEVFGLIKRKPAFEWVIYLCAIAFILSILYSLLLIVLNAKQAYDKNGNVVTLERK